MPTHQAHYPADLHRRLSAEWLGLTLALALLALVLSGWSQAPVIRNLNWLAYDLSMQVGARPPASDDIVIIAIDDASIETLGYWPWRRSMHAELLGHLGQARAVGLDLIYSDPRPTHPEDDRALAQAIATQGQVVLPAVLNPERQYLISPLPQLARAAAAIGRIDASPDHDGTLRSVELWRTAPDGTSLPHFSLALAQIMGDQPALRHAQGVAPNTKSLLQFTDPKQPYALYPYAAVLNGEVPDSAFKDRIVLVGAWASGLGDHLPTARGDGLVAGVEILANTMQNLKDSLWIRIPSAWLVALCATGLVLLVCLGLRTLSPRWGLAGVLAALAMFLLGDILLMSWARYWLPPAGPLVALVLAYPLWSWRSQEATLRHIDAELERMRIQPGQGAPLGRPWHGPNTLPQRAIRLHQAVSRLRRATQAQQETLSFISHDMRSPQNAILAAIDMRRHVPDPWPEARTLEHIEQQAHATLSLVDQFVQLARAESAPLNKHPCHLEDLLQDCCDRQWSRVSQRGIALQFCQPPREAIVNVDSDLVRRAIGNLLDNAILYSPDGSHIDCHLVCDGRNWHLHVQDQGPGIPPAQIEHLFTRFWRAPGTPQKPTGSGLGLAFVQTVAQRHGGRASCTSTPGQGARFTLSVPADS